MTFEEERIADEKAQAFHGRIAEILGDNTNPTPHQLIAAIGQVEAEARGTELEYVLDEQASIQ